MIVELLLPGVLAGGAVKGIGAIGAVGVGARDIARRSASIGGRQGYASAVDETWAVVTFCLRIRSFEGGHRIFDVRFYASAEGLLPVGSELRDCDSGQDADDGDDDEEFDEGEAFLILNGICHVHIPFSI